MPVQPPEHLERRADDLLEHVELVLGELHVQRVGDPLELLPGGRLNGHADYLLWPISSSSCSACAAPSRNAHASSICSRSPKIPKSTRSL